MDTLVKQAACAFGNLIIMLTFECYADTLSQMLEYLGPLLKHSNIHLQICLSVLETLNRLFEKTLKPHNIEVT
jgi:hypothetical protein